MGGTVWRRSSTGSEHQDEGQGADPAEVARQGFSGAAGPVPFRSEMERTLGADFGGVRSYTGAAVRQACRALGAEAYAVGRQIAFRDQDPSKPTVVDSLTSAFEGVAR